jgi:hypothetical protein
VSSFQLLDEALDVGGDYFFRRPWLLLFGGYGLAAAICHGVRSCAARVGRNLKEGFLPLALNPNFFV